MSTTLGTIEKVTPQTDLLRFDSLHRFISWRWFPYVFQVAMLAPLILLTILGWGQLTPSGVPDKLYAKANLVNLAIWGLFWPGLVWVTVLFGRVWCMVCPLELVSNVSERIGRHWGISQRALGSWLRAGWVILLFYATLQFLVAGVSLHRVPAYTAFFLLGLIFLAVLTGLFLRDRAFCRGFCPLALLLKIYGRGGALAVRSAADGVCQRCSEKHCVAASNRYHPDARSCPSLLNPAKLSDSQDCLLCTQCIKVCQPNNMQLLVRPPYARSDVRTALPVWPVTLFVMIASGFVTSELASEWPRATAVFQSPAEWATHVLGIEKLAGWIEGVWRLLVFPLLLWLPLGLLVMVFGGARRLSEAWSRIALPLAIVISAGHMAKGLAKIVSWVGFLPIAVREPDGIRTSFAMAAQEMSSPNSLLPMETVSVLALTVLGVAVVLAVREARLIDREGLIARALPVCLVAALFGFVIHGWAFQ